MGRFASALAFLFTLAVVIASAGCGDRFDDLGVPQQPSQSALASDALTALKEVRSAHVVLDAKGGTFSGTTAAIGIRFEGDVSTSALVGDLEVSFPGGTMGSRVMVGEHDAYVRFMGTWYHADSGFKDALKSAGDRNGEVLLELTTPTGLGRLFAQLFEGEISERPDLDGVATWEFEGRLRASAFADLVEEYGDVKLTEHDHALFEKVAVTSHLLVDVGQEDHLPRKVELTLDPPKDLHFDSEELDSSDGAFTVTVELSGFGEDVSFSAPKNARPLDELFGQLFGVMG